jgi:hypothetical protein
MNFHRTYLREWDGDQQMRCVGITRYTYRVGLATEKLPSAEKRIRDPICYGTSIREWFRNLNLVPKE